MEFITCCWGDKKWGYRVSIRTDTYCRSLAYVQELMDMLKKDHPGQEIKSDDVAIVIYNTDSFKGMMGVEWCTYKPNTKYFLMNLAPCIF